MESAREDTIIEFIKKLPEVLSKHPELKRTLMDALGIPENIGESLQAILLELKKLREDFNKQILELRKTHQDDMKHVLSEIERRIEEFKQNLADLKKLLSTLTIEGRSFTVDVDQIKEEIRTDKRKALKNIDKVLDPKIKTLVLHWNTPEVQILLNKLKEVISQFKALGSHKEKIHYVNDIEILAFIYGKLLFYIRGRKVPADFWEGLIELVHEKTIVKSFRTIVETKIDNTILKEVISRIGETISVKELIPEETVADAYRILRSLLEMDLANPVYREIYERIERARESWVKRNIDTPIYAQILSEASKEKIRYDEEIETKPIMERIVETVNLLINQHFKTEGKITLNLKTLREVVPKVV